LRARSLPFLLFAGLAACTPDASSAPDTARLVLRPPSNGEAEWTAHYTFTQPRSEMVFLRSRGDYRTDSWRPLDRGVRLTRIGLQDHLRFDTPAREARFAFRPVAGPFSRTYDPSLTFTDGGVALYLDQFSLLPLDALTARWGKALTLPTAQPGDFQPDEAARTPLRVTLDTAARTVFGTQAQSGPLSVCIGCGQDTPAYVYLGDTPLTDGESFTSLIDPGLPDWLGEALDQSIAESFATLTAMFGDTLSDKGQLIANFKGYALSGHSQSGSIADNMMILSFEGSAFGERNSAIADSLANFIAHEAAHLFQMRHVDFAYDDPWLHEGHATAMAYSVNRVAAGMLPPDTQARQDQEDAECQTALVEATLRDALRDKPYSCGQRVWRSLATSGEDLAKLWDSMIATADGVPLSETHLLASLPDPAPLRTALDLSGNAALDALK